MRTEAKMMAEAKQRAERAKRYALMFPKFIKGGEEKFQTVEWQLEQLRRCERHAPG